MKRLACSAVAVACLQSLSWAEPTTTPPSILSNATCSSASINVITHSLPQQCLRTNWTGSSASHDTTSTSVSSPTEQTITSTSETLILAPSHSEHAAIPHNSTVEVSPHTESVHEASPPSASQSSPLPPSSSSAPLAAEPTQTDEDSFLDAAKFLSFEDWKQQKLGEAADAAEALARTRGEPTKLQHRQRPGDGFDTLGEESEISLDFGFANAVRRTSEDQDASQSVSGNAKEGEAAAPDATPRLRNKDAGTTCKERFNYASFDCAASILKTNPKCKSSTSVLVENKDSYMLNECSIENKFLIVELCEHVEIDTIVLANFEFFSSMFRTFRVSVSDRYPVKIDKWRTLGTFEARNTREVQAFLVENPMLWAKYLRIEFLSHYGNEFYCPLSVLRVHGTNMVEDFRRMTDSGDEPEEVENAVVPVATMPPVAPAPDSASNENHKVVKLDATSVLADVEGVITDKSPAGVGVCPSSPLLPSERFEICPEPRSAKKSRLIASTSTFAFTLQSSEAKESSRAGTSYDSASKSATVTDVQNEASSTRFGSTTPPTSAVEPSHANITTQASSSTTTDASSQSVASSAQAISTSSLSSSSPIEPDYSPKLVSSPSASQQSPQPKPTSSFTSSAAVVPSIAPVAQAPSSKVAGAPQREQSPSNHPPTQESIFKSINRRLALLEANATLSLQYIESQSALLRSAFAATNSQQLNKTSSFLEKLNATVLNELARAKSDYDQLWQSTVLELHGQREEGRKEREILGERVRLLAEEVIGTKRLMAAQATLLLVVLGLVLFTRNAGPHPDGNGSSVDLRYLSSSVSGLMRHGRSSSNLKDSGARSTSGPRRRWQWESMSPWISPPPTRPGTSAEGEDGRRSSDESSRGPARDKPLPACPSGGSEDEHSDAASERRDTVTQRNFRPALRLDPQPNGANDTSPDGFFAASSPASPSPDDYYASMAREIQSAPTTPGLSSTGAASPDEAVAHGR